MILGIDVVFIHTAHRALTAIFDVGPSRVATFIDPDGNWMQLAQRKAAAEDE